MDEFEQIGRIGPYIFDQAVFNNILEYLHALIENNVTPIYIDEIGRYELNGHGYHDIIKTIVRHKLEAYFTCHQNLANEIIDYFNLEPVDIINVKGTNHV
jgi:nucleoside-triphosphatase THEP1